MSAIGSDFVKEPSRPRMVRCSECNSLTGCYATALVSIKGGKVVKRVCSEDCRLEFDARFWAHAARLNAGRRGR